MGDADSLTDPRPAEPEPARPDLVEMPTAPGTPSGPGAPETASADDPFDRLRAGLRREDAAERGWKENRPWRWIFRRRNDPGKGRPP